MAFELENTEKEVQDKLGWLYSQRYKGKENQATEALFKWFFFSSQKIQKLFLSKICGVQLSVLPWTKLNLQIVGKRGVPDAALLLKEGSKLLFEVKIKPDSVSRKQLKRHLKDAGLKQHGKRNTSLPRLILLTPDFREPPQVRHLQAQHREAIKWVPWNELMHFLKDLKGFTWLEQ